MTRKGDPVSRILAARAEIDQALFEARLQGRLEQAGEAAGMKRTAALRATRRINESLGRPIRWGNN